MRNPSYKETLHDMKSISLQWRNSRVSIKCKACGQLVVNSFFLGQHVIRYHPCVFLQVSGWSLFPCGGFLSAIPVSVRYHKHRFITGKKNGSLLYSSLIHGTVTEMTACISFKLKLRFIRVLGRWFRAFCQLFRDCG